LAALVLGFYWQLLLPTGRTWLAGSDLIGQVMPWAAHTWGEVQAGRPPLWDPNHFLGQPLLGQGQPQAVFPLNWLLYALPLPSGWPRQMGLHWYFALLHLLAARSAYLLARSLGASRWGSILGGLAFTLTAWMGSTFWPQMLAGAVTAPLVFLYIIRLPDGRRPWIDASLGGLFLGLCWLSGHHQIPIFVSLAAAAIGFHALWKDRRLGGPLALFWIFAFAAGALQTLPAVEYGRLAVRWVNASHPVGWTERVPYAVHTRFSLAASALGSLFTGEHGLSPSPFVGFSAFSLAICAVAACWRRTVVRLLLALGILALLYALGAATPLEGLAYGLIPTVEKARAPAMAIVLFGLAVAMLAALGLDAVLFSARGAALARKLIGPLLAGCLVLACGSLVAGVAFWSAWVPVLAALTLAGLLAAWSSGRLPAVAVAASLCGLLLAESAAATWWRLPGPAAGQTDLAFLSSHADLAEYLRSHAGMSRVDVDERAIAYNFGDWFGLPQYNGYLASVTTNVYRLGLHSDAVRRLAGVEYLAANEPTPMFRQEVFRSRSGVRVFRNSDVQTRAFAVHRAVTVAGRGGVAAAIDSLGRDATRTVVLVEPAPSLEDCGVPDAVWIDRYSSQRVSIEARMGCRGMVILSDTAYPGWEAEVDGKPAKIWDAYGAFRGVVVESGRHRLEFHYRPASVLIGAVFTAIAAAAAAGLAFRERLMRRG
jgi:hypothetical protein